MRVLVTGAGGNLGRAVVPALVAAGHHPVLFDMRELDGDEEFVKGDVRDSEALARVVAGVDAVVHGAALHGIHLRTWSPADFWSINVTGTFNVYEAARRAGVGRVVLGSSMAVYGDQAAEQGWQLITEETPTHPTNVYGLTKVLSEDIARYHAHDDAIGTVALRFGMFVPETFERYGFRLLFGGVDDRDVAQSVLAALDHQSDTGFDAFDIMADNGLTGDDLGRLHRDLPALLDERWPGTAEVLRSRSLDLSELVWGRSLYPVDRAVSELKYRPQYNFGGFVEALRKDDRTYYPFADMAWWGADRPN